LKQELEETIATIGSDLEEVILENVPYERLGMLSMKKERRYIAAIVKHSSASMSRPTILSRATRPDNQNSQEPQLSTIFANAAASRSTIAHQTHEEPCISAGS
jgi:hypothetical protein